MSSIPFQLQTQLMKYQIQGLNKHIEGELIKAICCAKCHAMPEDQWENNIVVDPIGIVREEFVSVCWPINCCKSGTYGRVVLLA